MEEVQRAWFENIKTGIELKYQHGIEFKLHTGNGM